MAYIKESGVLGKSAGGHFERVLINSVQNQIDSNNAKIMEFNEFISSASKLSEDMHVCSLFLHSSYLCAVRAVVFNGIEEDFERIMQYRNDLNLYSEDLRSEMSHVRSQIEDLRVQNMQLECNKYEFVYVPN